MKKNTIPMANQILAISTCLKYPGHILRSQYLCLFSEEEQVI